MICFLRLHLPRPVPDYTSSGNRDIYCPIRSSGQYLSVAGDGAYVPAAEILYRLGVHVGFLGVKIFHP